MRMVDAPIDLPIVKLEPVGGPTLDGQTSSNTRYIQNVVNPFSLWKFKVDFAPMRGSAARAFDTWRYSLLSGANCTRFQFFDPQEPTYADFGLEEEHLYWSNNLPWSNGELWTIGKPQADVLAASAKGSTIITVDLTNWNGVVPAWIGFFNHFAVYHVIGSDVAGTTARLKITPPLRKAVTVYDLATLRPTIAVTQATEGGMSGEWEGPLLVNASLTFVEVTDEVVQTSVTEGF